MDDELETWAGETTGIVLDPATFANIRDYWTHGEGAAKIRWGTEGSFKRCVRHLRKYFPQDPEGLCANLHHEATGQWPRGGVPS
jgi:hypothetical protein